MKNNSFREQYGPWALVTGGASGIGAEFAAQLAARGLNVVLVDVQAEMMRAHAAMLRETFGIEASAITIDMARPDFLKKIRRATGMMEIGLLVNNAAWGSVGEFMNTDPEEMLRTVDTNCRAPLALAREFGPAMAGRGRGGIIFLASSSALQGSPVIANYAATKAYNLVLAEALWEEMAPCGVDVLALCPGATDTPAFSKSGAKIANVPGMPFMSPGEVVAEALAALGTRPSIIAGRMNRIASFVMTRLLSRAKAVRYMGQNTRKLYPDSAAPARRPSR
ncbi:MAG TPA: SDR family NAD(P)-dependent oxidoreductase [Spirochaetota bacterium]|nr:SDR family NAD(P)-dependent oxidoreductase [Spirochaetota bacterium]HOD15484.1 SDR family NAD(P)-dependent oxidoreductase [Spirochaetota bacterium]HPG51936.1 SDR family NAD(P)-dependent oxidoreductase [Spirochaetota bacterium]HPN12631.1 SDR family NAD(P)-dependent oxidoreductase [Spirochaetota bacterium]HQL80858.1 SDR family NAD(P)-dependent oxidoreductase [Spirochaetota bacterium]